MKMVAATPCDDVSGAGGAVRADPEEWMRRQGSWAGAGAMRRADLKAATRGSWDGAATGALPGGGVWNETEGRFWFLGLADEESLIPGYAAAVVEPIEWAVLVEPEPS